MLNDVMWIVLGLSVSGFALAVPFILVGLVFEFFKALGQPKPTPEVS